jgi:anti-sigma regulatory factor (Ser/Thr protein kinase)
MVAAAVQTSLQTTVQTSLQTSLQTVVPASRYVDAAEPVAGSPARIRRALRTALAQWGLPAEAVENALMVVEELVANVVDHARTPFRLTVDHLLADHPGPSLRIAVRDGCPGPVHVRPFDAHAHRGRGLQMIEGLASRWGCHRTPGGKTVWAVVPA